MYKRKLWSEQAGTHVDLRIHLASPTYRLVHDKVRAFETGRQIYLSHLKIVPRVKEKPRQIQTVIERGTTEPDLETPLRNRAVERNTFSSMLPRPACT